MYADFRLFFFLVLFFVAVAAEEIIRSHFFFFLRFGEICNFDPGCGVSRCQVPVDAATTSSDCARSFLILLFPSTLSVKQTRLKKETLQLEYQEFFTPLFQFVSSKLLRFRVIQICQLNERRIANYIWSKFSDLFILNLEKPLNSIFQIRYVLYTCTLNFCF